MRKLEICCDASQKTFHNPTRTFTCAGAISLDTNNIRYRVLPDSTNNQGELLGVYLACELALLEKATHPMEYEDEVNVYCDSQVAVFGLTQWIDKWLRSQKVCGVMLGYNSKEVVNANMYQMIITFCVTNNLNINLMNQKGHVKIGNRVSLAQANAQFYKANGFHLTVAKLIQISQYNNTIDQFTRKQLDTIDVNSYPVAYHSSDGLQMIRYKIPDNYKNYIH